MRFVYRTVENQTSSLSVQTMVFHCSLNYGTCHLKNLWSHAENTVTSLEKTIGMKAGLKCEEEIGKGGPRQSAVQGLDIFFVYELVSIHRKNSHDFCAGYLKWSSHAATPHPIFCLLWSTCIASFFQLISQIPYIAVYVLFTALSFSWLRYYCRSIVISACNYFFKTWKELF